MNTKTNNALAKFESILVSWAHSRDLKRDCLGVWCVETALVELISCDSSQQYSDAELVALAGMISELRMFVGISVGFFPNMSESARTQEVEEEQSKELERSAQWLASNSAHLNFVSAEKLLDDYTSQLFNKYGGLVPYANTERS
jgi:hypothetical protein